MRTEGYSTKILEFDEGSVRLTSYKLGETYHCTADNVDPGARLSRAQGASREEAEERAGQQARKLLSRHKHSS